jgi:hypothetical protein
MAKEVVAGIAGGIVGAGLARLTAPPQQRVTSSKEVIGRYMLAPGQTLTLRPTITYKFAIILFHGDGDSEVRVDIVKGETTTSIYGNQQAIEVLANETIKIDAVNTDTTIIKAAPIIEIVSLSW